MSERVHELPARLVLDPATPTMVTTYLKPFDGL